MPNCVRYFQSPWGVKKIVRRKAGRVGLQNDVDRVYLFNSASDEVHTNIELFSLRRDDQQW